MFSARIVWDGQSSDSIMRRTSCLIYWRKITFNLAKTAQPINHRCMYMCVVMFGYKRGVDELCSDDELHDLPEESLLYSPEKTDPVSRVDSDRPKSEIVSSVCHS